MKKMEILVSGEYEKKIAHEILLGIYAALQNNEYVDVSVKADTIEERPQGEFDVPAFMRRPSIGHLEENMTAMERGKVTCRK